MKKVEVSIDVTPFVCTKCGQLQLMEDQEALQKPGNCNNADCESDKVVRAGPLQEIKLFISQGAKAHFDKGEK